MAKKFKITNNILATAVIIAIVISAGGTWIALDELTGRASDAFGSSNVTVTAVTAIEIVAGAVSIDWGGGYVWDNVTGYATLWSENLSSIGGSWVEATVPSINLTNTGNTVVNITMDSDKTVADFADGSWFKYKASCADGEATCCNGTSVGALQNVSYLNLTSTYNAICNSTRFAASADELAIYIGLGISTGESAGDFNASLTFNAVAV